MVYVVPLVYTVRIPFTAKGQAFATGDVLTAAQCQGLKLGMLVGAGRLVAEPDTNWRTKGKGSLPTYIHPKAIPGTAALTTGTITVSNDPELDNPNRAILDADFEGPTHWDFGDGITSTQQDNHTVHGYMADGTYNVKARSTTHEATATVTVPMVGLAAAEAPVPKSGRRSKKASTDTVEQEPGEPAP